MKKIITMGIVFLFTNVSYADYGLETYGSGYEVDSKTPDLRVANMPKTISQDTIGLCYAAVAATLFDEANCFAKKTADCASVSKHDKASILDMSRFGQKVGQEDDQFLESYDAGIKEGGWAPFALRNAALRVNSVARESCAPFDQVVAKVNSPKDAFKLEEAMWKNLKNKYTAYAREKKKCADCDLNYATALGDEVRKNFDLKASNTDILKAFSEDTYEKFLDKLLIPESCLDEDDGDKRISLKGKWKQSFYPENEKSNYDSMLTEIKNALGKKRPIAMSFCTQVPLKAKSQKACGEAKGASQSGMHAIVIKGYRRVCNVKKKNECHDAVQVQNSWGEGWQRANDDGWVDAKELLNRTFYETYSMSWLEPK